jgi:hypothetical protein
VDAFDVARSIAYVIYAVLAAVVGAVVGVVICPVQTVAEYLIGCAQVLAIRPDGLPERQRVFTPPAGDDPARPSYFYGPARSDLRYVRQVFWSRWQNAADFWSEAVGDMLEMGGSSGAAAGPLAVGLFGGLVVALPLAAVLAAAAGLAHEVLVDAATISVHGTASTLRAVDSALLRVRHIKIRCVACFERLPYPAYLCPNPKCRDIHWNIRPGPHGVLRRKCDCGQPMPTLLLLGSARKLDAICSHRACKQPLEHRPGEVREVIFPIFGAKGAGKTLLLYGIIKTLQGSVRPGIRVEPGDASTASRIRDLDSALAEDYPVPATPAAELPKAYVLRLRIGRYRRIVQLIDAAGELFYSSQRSADLVYLGEANTFVLVIDPLSINDFWDRLPSAERDRLAADRSVAPHPQLVYQQTADRILEMGEQRAPRRLAVVLSRADVIGKEFGPGASTGDGVRTWTEDALGLAGLMREAKLDFRDVAWFHTAPFGSKENCLTDLVHWLMRAEGTPLDLAGLDLAGLDLAGLDLASDQPAHRAFVGCGGEGGQRPGSPVPGRPHPAVDGKRLVRVIARWHIDDLRPVADRARDLLGAVWIGAGGHHGDLDHPGRTRVSRLLGLSQPRLGGLGSSLSRQGRADQGPQVLVGDRSRDPFRPGGFVGGHGQSQLAQLARKATQPPGDLFR